ncbi:membrane protein [Streptomyces eurocidicus]|uniref:Membrane protein n=1 Tax=Streptomyces eurocidicus TaxID=66423 RepID=A0A2N8P1Q4_STREU|nr:DUF2752 domain-containing protein [Streptomyces eurocidicus]MBB5118490.1 hypothetical protein [Streptomyces eurocidicus]MBF6051943.1 DUF2752 domain-containing protein [Streptomyces eurocidicus]PNE34941.1 membrane protein [Streptomyces eurocidicus]
MSDSAGRAPARAVARRLTAPLGVAAGIAVAAGYVAAVDPGRPGHYPACPLLRYTGLYCPGCGGLRGLHALCHGDLAAAVGANALAVAGYAAFALLWAVWTVRVLRGAGGIPVFPRAAQWWALGGLVLAFTVVRNLPCGSALVP